MRKLKLALLGSLMILALVGGIGDALAVVGIDKIGGLPPTTKISIPDLEFEGTSNEDGEITGIDLVCKEGSKHEVMDASGQPLKDKNGIPVVFICTPEGFMSTTTIVAALGVGAGAIALAIAAGNSNDTATGGGTPATPPATQPAGNPIDGAYTGDGGCRINTLTVLSSVLVALNYTQMVMSLGGQSATFTGGPSLFTTPTLFTIFAIANHYVEFTLAVTLTNITLQMLALRPPPPATPIASCVETFTKPVP